MGRSAAGGDACPPGATCDADEQPEHDATVSSFALDTFEVTVGRFRTFVNAYNGTPPAAGAGAHPLIAGSGWLAAWNTSLPASQAALKTNLACKAGEQTWTDTPGANEAYAINCVSWYEAFAFCAWDGGRLPTEAEWEYAAAGGSENRLYPWGSTDPTSDYLASWWRGGSGSPFVAVGSYPLGNGRWGHRDLAGGVWEWNFDEYDSTWYSGGGSACNDCARVGNFPSRVTRGGNWRYGAEYLRAADRYGPFAPEERSPYVGFRCARAP
jgi:formylglycine-generating enzyme required for sulfatase activity